MKGKVLGKELDSTPKITTTTAKDKDK